MLTLAPPRNSTLNADHSLGRMLREKPNCPLLRVVFCFCSYAPEASR
jgi:hypothetical protein